MVASIDFAYSNRKSADYTAIVVVGVDSDNNIYVLDINRFQTDRISDYFKELLAMHNRWGFRKLMAETTAAQQAIVRSLKQDFFAPHGLMIRVEEVKPTKHEGSKEERMEAVLVPRYENQQVFHYKGGNTQVLEDELVSNNPPHDDVKDALATAIEGCIRPSKGFQKRQEGNVHYHPRFGGRSF